MLRKNIDLNFNTTTNRKPLCVQLHCMCTLRWYASAHTCTPFLIVEPSNNRITRLHLPRTSTRLSSSQRAYFQRVPKCNGKTRNNKRAQKILPKKRMHCTSTCTHMHGPIRHLLVFRRRHISFFFFFPFAHSHGSSPVAT